MRRLVKADNPISDGIVFASRSWPPTPTMAPDLNTRIRESHSLAKQSVRARSRTKGKKPIGKRKSV